MVKYILEDEDKEKTLKLCLVKFGNKIDLRGTDNEGRSWNIICFNEDGTFYRYTKIKKDIGLQVDEIGKIKPVNKKEKNKQTIEYPIVEWCRKACGEFKSQS